MLVGFSKRTHIINRTKNTENHDFAEFCEEQKCDKHRAQFPSGQSPHHKSHYRGKLRKVRKFEIFGVNCRLSYDILGMCRTFFYSGDESPFKNSIYRTFNLHESAFQFISRKSKKYFIFIFLRNSVNLDNSYQLFASIVSHEKKMNENLSHARGFPLKTLCFFCFRDLEAKIWIFAKRNKPYYVLYKYWKKCLSLT